MIRSTSEQYSILVVDDDPSFRSILKNIFASAHYYVQTAEDGKAACEILEAQPFDLVITDIQMPHINGIELARQISQNHPSTSIIIMGGNLNDEQLLPLIKERAYPCLPKPFRKTEVLELSQELLNSHGNRAIS